MVGFDGTLYLCRKRSSNLRQCSLKCSVCAHWNCLAQIQREEILNAVLERDRALWRNEHPPPDPATVSNETEAAPPIVEPEKRLGLDAYQTTEFVCGSCAKGAFCIGCKELAIEPGSALRDARTNISVIIPQVSESKEPADAPDDCETSEQHCYLMSFILTGYISRRDSGRRPRFPVCDLQASSALRTLVPTARERVLQRGAC